MSSVRKLFLVMCLLMLSASSAFAYSFRLEITATGSLDGNAGYILKSTDELISFNFVGGSGYFPLAVGNWWEYDQLASAVGDVPGTPNMLHAAVPNPFNPSTKISFEMAAAGHARLAIYDAAGRHVRTLVDGQRAAGSHAMTWDGRDNSGRGAAAGVYLYRFESGRSVQTRTMTLVK